MESVELEKMVKLVEQCLERIKSCIIRKHESPTPVISFPPLSASQQTAFPAINATNHPKLTGEPLFSLFKVFNKGVYEVACIY